MPYYSTLKVTDIPSSVEGSTDRLQTDCFYERLGYRSKPPKEGTVALIPGKVAEPYSWLDSYSAIKQRAYVSSHPEMASLFKKDRGHAWDLSTAEFKGKPMNFRMTFNGSNFLIGSNVRPFSGDSLIMKPLSLLGTDSQLSNYAALEYGRTAPTTDQLSMSAFVGELREGLPSLIPAFLTTGSKRSFKSTLQRQTRRAKDAGGDYLNVQFGWIPLLADVRKIATALAVATAAISGQQSPTHRRRIKQEKDETTSGSYSTWFWMLRHSMPAFGDPLADSYRSKHNNLAGKLWYSQRHQIDYSFEAEFVRLPEGQKDYSSYLTRLDELMRWDITPMDLWQLAPWSWLVDWFFDIGGQLDAWNSATSNRILSLYAYGMRDERLTTTYILSDVSSFGDGRIAYLGDRSNFHQIITRRRQRIRANPFGYTPDPLVQLSAGQLAILGALGLTKTRR